MSDLTHLSHAAKLLAVWRQAISDCGQARCRDDGDDARLYSAVVSALEQAYPHEIMPGQSPDPLPPSGNDVDLRPCPFCGGEAQFVRRGTSRQSCIIACTACGARLETSEVHDSGHAWNARVL